MSEENNGQETTTAPHHRGHCNTSRRTRLGITAALLLALGAAGGALVATATGASAHAFGSYARFARHHGHDFEDVKAHAEKRVAWILGAVDASDTQIDQVGALVGDFAERVQPLVETHRERKRALLAELSRPTLDRDALERLRVEALATADAVTAELVEATVRAGEILTAEQREQLAGMAKLFVH